MPVEHWLSTCLSGLVLGLRVGDGTDDAEWHNLVHGSCRRCRTSACCQSTCPATSTIIRRSTRSRCRRSRKACSVPTCRHSVAMTWTTRPASWQTSTTEPWRPAREVSSGVNESTGGQSVQARAEMVPGIPAAKRCLIIKPKTVMLLFLDQIKREQRLNMRDFPFPVGCVVQR